MAGSPGSAGSIPRGSLGETRPVEDSERCLSSLEGDGNSKFMPVATGPAPARSTAAPRVLRRSWHGEGNRRVEMVRAPTVYALHPEQGSERGRTPAWQGPHSQVEDRTHARRVVYTMARNIAESRVSPAAPTRHWSVCRPPSETVESRVPSRWCSPLPTHCGKPNVSVTALCANRASSSSGLHGRHNGARPNHRPWATCSWLGQPAGGAARRLGGRVEYGNDIDSRQRLNCGQRRGSLYAPGSARMRRVY